MTDCYEEYQRQVFLSAEAEALVYEQLEAHSDPVFHALGEGDLGPLIRYLRKGNDITPVPLSRPLANHLADMLQVHGKSLFRLNIAGRLTGERGREHRLRISHRRWLIGYCADRLIEDVRRTKKKNAKWAKGEVGAELSAGKTTVQDCLQLVRKYLAAKARHRSVLNSRYSEEYDKRFGPRVKLLKASPMANG